MPSFFPILGPNSVYGVMKNAMNDKNYSTESVSGSLDKDAPMEFRKKETNVVKIDVLELLIKSTLFHRV